MRFSLSAAIFPLAVFAAAVPKPVVKSDGIAVKLTRHAPFPNPENGVGVDVLQVKNHIASLNAILRGFDNYEKNMGTTHPYAVRNGNGIRERGAGIPLMSDHHHIWLGKLSIGTPPKTLNVEIITGNCDLFVKSIRCTSTCVGHTPWDPDGSSTSRYRTVVDGRPKEFDMMVADGMQASGILYVDNVTISGFTADEQTFGAASYYYSPARDGQQWAPDGQLGLAFQSISVFPIASKPLLATLVYDEVIDPVFSILLGRDGGELYIGGVNPDHYRGEWTYAYVTTMGFWQVNIGSIQDNRGRLAEEHPSYMTKIPAIIDTGCNYIVADPSRAAVMYDALGGTRIENGFYAFPCISFPTISFGFGDKSFRIPPTLLNVGSVSSGSDLCFSSIIVPEFDTNVWIIGTPFLQGYYTTFDFGDNPRVGFAELQ